MLWFLLIWAAVTRLPWLLSGTILFGFDHGRDALTVFNFIKTLNPVFVGPPTSIPGLFVGPGWYYFLAPAYFLGQGNPITAGWLMFILFLIVIVLAKKYCGTYEAVIFATAPMWLLLSTSAQSPNPIPILGLLLIIGLIKKWPVFYLGLIIGLGFNFDSALAIFWMILIPLMVKPKQWSKLAAGGIIPFIPQILFEFKHNFSQTKAVIAYFVAGESQQITPGKISLVTQSVLHEMNLAILPDNIYLKIAALIIFITGLAILIQQRKFNHWKKILLLTVVPLIGFWFLHYNPWYSNGMLPLAVIVAGKVLRSLPKPLAIVFILLLLANSAIKLYQFETADKFTLAQHKGFLPAKFQALDYIYEQTGSKPFASYHYHPEIYDYAYQYLYIWQAYNGKPLPVEFSYQPGAPTYIPEKENLLSLLSIRLRQGSGEIKPELIFLIIEKPDNVWHYPFDSWLKQINYSEIVYKKIIGPELEVWTVQAY